MSIRKLIDVTYDISLNIRETITTELNMLINEKQWKFILKENRKFENAYKGKRCFIL